ncbi:hypothetical protein ACP70R_015890 [Stipagrostis hirtigluma subsp. patula]
MNCLPRCRLLQVIILFFLAAAIAEQQPQKLPPITLPGCPDKCGNISIPFPFGVKPGCFLDDFQVTCNHSFQPPRLFLEFNGSEKSHHEVSEALYTAGVLSDAPSDSSVWPVELLDISLSRAEARAYGMIRCNCVANGTSAIHRLQATRLTEPFILAVTRNVLIGVGWNVQVDMRSSLYTSSMTSLTCVSDTVYDPKEASSGICSGLGCCQSIVTPAVRTENRRYFGVGFKYRDNIGMYANTNPCSYGMMVESSWYNFSTQDMYGYHVLPNRLPRGVPFVISFAIRNGSCPMAGRQPPQDYACRSGNSFCANAIDGQGYVCKCLEHYDGNPYIPDGCQDIDECALRDQYPELRKDYPCSSDAICVNRLGGYDCRCKAGMKGDGKAGICTEQFPLPAKLAVGSIGILLSVAIVVFFMLVRREKRRMKEFFEKNGGPLLEKVNNIKIFKKEELKPILRSCNIVGKGAFGEVYKGLLGGNQVAVKKSINVDAAQKEQFANEVIIQSRIIHKNIVKLIGCCLEVDIPMLVYEFISRGSLDDILHDHRMMPLNLDLRLRIAAESAEGLAYMHSTAKILHGDVKPANILLDDEFVPKISDFGISRLIAIDKEHHTEYVIGDRSYVDPVYIETGLLTKKSDVYSFGVVLLELICRKKAIYSDNNSLVKSFLDAHKIERTPTELFDKEITAPRDMEFLDCLAGIAVECLNLDVDERPEMTQVAERLLMLRRSRDN